MREELQKKIKNFSNFSIQPSLLIRYIIILILIISAINNTHSIFTNKLLNNLQTIFAYDDTTIKETSETGKDIINIGVNFDIAGLGQYNEKTQKYYGMEIDIAKHIAQQLGYQKVHFDPMNPQPRAQALLNDREDFVISSCTIRNEPPTGCVYSTPYLETHSSIIAIASTEIENSKDLQGMKLGLITNSANIEQTKNYLYGRNIEPEYEYYDDYDALFDALVEGEIDALSTDEKIISAYAETSNLSLNESFNTFNYGILVKEGNPIIDSINSILSKMKEDGSLETIINKWND